MRNAAGAFDRWKLTNGTAEYWIPLRVFYNLSETPSRARVSLSLADIQLDSLASWHFQSSAGDIKKHAMTDHSGIEIRSETTEKRESAAV